MKNRPRGARLPRTGETVADMNTDNTAVTVTELAPACVLPVRERGPLSSGHTEHS